MRVPFRRLSRRSFSRHRIRRVAVLVSILAVGWAVRAGSAPPEAAPGHAPKAVWIHPRPGPRGLVDAATGRPFQLDARAVLVPGGTREIRSDVTWTVTDPSVLHISDGSDGNPIGWASPLRPGVVGVTITYPRVGWPAAASPGATRGRLGDAIQVVVRDERIPTAGFRETRVGPLLARPGEIGYRGATSVERSIR